MVNQKIVAGLNAAVFTGAQIALVPLLPYFAENLHLSLAQVLMLFALGSALFVWGSPYWAQKSDATGRASVLVGAQAGLFLSMALLGLVVMFPSSKWEFNFIALALSRLIYGLTASGIAPVAQAWQSDLAMPEEQNAAMARHSLSLSVGRFIALTGVVALAARPIALIAVLLTTAALSFGLNQAARAAMPGKDPAPRISANKYSLFILWPVFSLAFFFTSSVELINSSLSPVLQQLFTLDAREAARFVAQLLLGASAVVLLAQLIARRMLVNSWRMPLMAGGACLLAGALTLLIASSRPEVWAALSLISIALGLIPPSYLSALAGTKASRAERGKAAGYLASTQTLGYATGAALSAGSFHFFHGDRGPALGATVGIAIFMGLYLLARAPVKEQP